MRPEAKKDDIIFLCSGNTRFKFSPQVEVHTFSTYKHLGHCITYFHLVEVQFVVLE